jgi:hypothetical protein
MRRELLMVLAALLTAFTLSIKGCGDNGDDDDSTARDGGTAGGDAGTGGGEAGASGGQGGTGGEECPGALAFSAVSEDETEQQSVVYQEIPDRDHAPGDLPGYRVRALGRWPYDDGDSRLLLFVAVLVGLLIW